MNTLRADWSQDMLATIRCRIFWNAVCYPKKYKDLIILTHSIKQSPSWEASQKVTLNLLNPKVHYYIHNYQPTIPILSQISPTHALPSNFVKKKKQQNFDIKIVKFSVVLYGCETWSLIFKRNIVWGCSRIGCWGNYLGLKGTGWDRGSAVVKVLCYKLEGRRFDPSWCHWNFSLTWNPSDRTMVLGSTQPLTEMSTRSIFCG